MVDREACDAAEKKKCLIVQGARQVGKTFVMEEFTAEEYEELLEINFKKTPSAMEIFSGDLSVAKEWQLRWEAPTAAFAGFTFAGY